MLRGGVEHLLLTSWQRFGKCDLMISLATQIMSIFSLIPPATLRLLALLSCFFFYWLIFIKASFNVGLRMVETLTHSEVTSCQEFCPWSRTSAFTWINLVALNQPGWHLCCWLFTDTSWDPAAVKQTETMFGWQTRAPPKMSWENFACLLMFPWYLVLCAEKFLMVIASLVMNLWFNWWLPPRQQSISKIKLQSSLDEGLMRCTFRKVMMLLRLQLFKINLNKSHVRAWKSEFRGNV